MLIAGQAPEICIDHLAAGILAALQDVPPLLRRRQCVEAGEGALEDLRTPWRSIARIASSVAAIAARLSRTRL